MKIKENRNIFNLNNNKSNKINQKMNDLKITKHNTSKGNSIINKDKFLENEGPLMKPIKTGHYFHNYQYSTKTLNNNKDIHLNININTIGHTNTMENSFNNLNKIGYIKVNKTDKSKSMKVEQNLEGSKKIKINMNQKYISNRKKRDSSKNHGYKEVNLTNINGIRNKLSSNSLGHYYPSETNEEFNTSNKCSMTTNTSERNNILKYSLNSFNQNSKKNIDISMERNLSNKSNGLFLNHRLNYNRFNKNDKKQNELNSSSNRFNHNYYESKSTKKDRQYSEIYSDYNKKYNYKKTNRNKNENLNDKKNDVKYFYSYYDFNSNNNNNYLTEKKFNRTINYYH